MDMGGYVIIVNADKVIMTGNKMSQKLYRSHPTAKPGTLKTENFKQLNQVCCVCPAEQSPAISSITAWRHWSSAGDCFGVATLYFSCRICAVPAVCIMCSAIALLSGFHGSLQVHAFMLHMSLNLLWAYLTIIDASVHRRDQYDSF